MTALTVAIVGTGTIAGFHAKALADQDGRARIVAATDVVDDALAAFCQRWSVPRRYPGLAALLERENPDLASCARHPDCTRNRRSHA